MDRTNLRVRTQTGSRLRKALGGTPRDPGRPVFSEHVRGPLAASSRTAWWNCRALVEGVRAAAAGEEGGALDFAFDRSFPRVLAGHFVKSQQGAAAGQRLCKAEFAEGGLHAAVTDAVVPGLVWGRKHRFTGVRPGKGRASARALIRLLLRPRGLAKRLVGC